MESFVNFSGSNIENFIKNKKLKENFSMLDFSHFRRILKKLKRFQILQNTEEVNDNVEMANSEIDFESPAMDEMIENYLIENQHIHEGIVEGVINNEEEVNNIEERIDGNSNSQYFNNSNIQHRLGKNWDNFDYSFQQTNTNNFNGDHNNYNYPNNNVEYNNAELRMKQLEEITDELKNNLFNIKGRVHKIYTQVNREKLIDGVELTINRLRFDVDMIIRDEELEYSVSMRRIKSDLIENLNKFSKNSTIFLTNMKAFIEIDGDEHKIIFRHRIDTKVYVQHSNLTDNSNPLIFNNTIRIIYEMEKKKLMDKKNLENSRITIQNSFFNSENAGIGATHNQSHGQMNLTYSNTNGSINNTISNPNGYFVNLTNQNLFDITKSNEEEYLDIIDSSVLNNCLSQIPYKYKDFSKLLVKNVENSIYSISNIMRINSNITFNDICGMIKSYKIEEKLITIEVVSLKDSNIIKIHHYNKNMLMDLKENMVVLFKNIASKVNKNFDLYLENPIESNTKILGILNTAEANKMKKFRFDKNKDFDCIIDLVKPVIRRNIQKFLLNIKKIYKVMAINEKDLSGVIGFPDLRLIAKCLVDDGTFEAQVYFYDQTVVNLLRIDKATLQVRAN